MYSLTGNRQGAEEGQDESRALVGAFPGEGALASLGEGAAFRVGACPLEFLVQGGFPWGDPWEASYQEVGPSCLEGGLLGP